MFILTNILVRLHDNTSPMNLSIGIISGQKWSLSLAHLTTLPDARDLQQFEEALSGQISGHRSESAWHNPVASPILTLT